ncbi:cysteine hydrolase family protein (plasmid) [Arthrobacter sp. UC242_113]|uniref:cysteine hydrolase family protein n=1 Tax=Arthrobacter sp. UC242_113 TaxID=3374550 RepID=UPI0037565365
MGWISYEQWMGGVGREPFTFSKSPTALLVVDMQKVFLEPEHSMAPEGTDLSALRSAIGPCLKLIEAARESNQTIIYARLAHMADNADEAPANGRRALGPPTPKTRTEGTVAAELIDDIQPKPGEFIIDKSRFSCFIGTRLEPLLQARGIRRLIICGVTTNICVESTARDAHQRSYETFVVEDASAEYDEEQHWRSLYTIQSCFGTVVTVEDVIRSWKAAALQQV